MGLYDGYKLSNSSYISQYVGNIVPELKEFSTNLKKRYDDARDSDDSLLEAMGNLQHLDTEEDTTYANELKTTYLNKLDERASRGDYENMGRRTQRDAKLFVSEYTPLVTRLKGMQAIQERVLQDTGIFSDVTKKAILGKIKHMNSAKRDAKGNFIRGADGKIQLGTINDWAYAKDVDIDKKNLEILKELQTTETQSGYSISSDGKMLQSVKHEVRSPQDIARLAKERMQNDPEIRAMIERDVELSTYHLTDRQFTKMAEEDNVSIYSQLKKAGNSDAQIRTYAAAHGMTFAQTQAKPLDEVRNMYALSGRNPQEADKDYVRNKVRQQLIDPHVNFIANLLKVDKSEIDAKVDPEYAARATASAMNVGGGGVMPLEVSTTGVDQLDVVKLQNDYADAVAPLEETGSKLRATIGTYFGLGRPSVDKSSDYYNKTGKILNSKEEQGKAIQKLVNAGKRQEANNLSVAFDEYNSLNNRMIIAQQKLETVRQGVDLMPLYKEYVRAGNKDMKFSDFTAAMQAPNKVEKTWDASFIGGQPVPSRKINKVGDNLFKKAIDSVFGGDEKPMIKSLRTKYFDMLEAEGKRIAPTMKTTNTIFEPTGDGYIAKNTIAIEEDIKNGKIKGKVMETGEDIDMLMTKLSGQGREDILDPKSDYSQFMKQVSVRINMQTKGSTGEPTATIFTPKGNYTVTMDNVPRTLPTEMGARTLLEAGRNMTRTEATYQAQQIARGAGISAITHMTAAEMVTAQPSSKPYQLNDLFYMKVQNAGVKGVAVKPVYSLLVKSGDKFIPIPEVTNKESVVDLQTAIGRLDLENLMQANPSTNFLR